MIQSLYSKVYSEFVRFLIYLLVKRKTFIKSENRFTQNQVNKLMKTFEEQLIEKKYLTPHVTEGPKRVKSKSSIKLMDAFITKRLAKEEDDFYMQVARTWVEEYEEKFHKSSLLISFLFVIFWLFFIFLNQYMTTLIEDIYYLVLFFLPIVGFFIALIGRGWRSAGLTMLNFTLLLVAMITYL